MKHTRFAQESAAQAQAEAQKPVKDINWAVREICKAYGHAPSCTGGTAELADILKELLEAQAEARKATIEALTKAREHLEYCGYGDKWERECAFAQRLPELLETAIKEASK